MRIRTIVVAFFVCSILWSSSAMAQQKHVVDVAAMRQAVVAQVQADQQNRDAVLGALHQPQVRELAHRLGLSVTRAESAVATLDSAELARLAASVRAAKADLAGGSNTIVISTTTLLLLLIIVILLVK
jgi:hypothetical protein